MTSAFYHIKTLPTHVKYLGADFRKVNGNTQHFVYIFLPFWVLSPVYVMTKIMKPISAYISAMGICHSIYFDDGQALAGSQGQASQKYLTMINYK